MKAIVCKKFESLDVLHLEEVSKPAPTEDEVHSYITLMYLDIQVLLQHIYKLGLYIYTLNRK